MTQFNTLSTLPRLTELTLKKINNLNNIQYNAFYTGPEQSKSPKLPLLNSFHLSDIPTLTAIPVAAIQELNGLTELEISGTGITRVYPQTFSPFYKLINLHVTNNNYLTTIDSGAFDGIYDTLEFLFLGHNNLQSLTSLFTGNWQKLTQLNLLYNPIRTVQASDFSTLGPKLRYLNLDSCKLTIIHSSMFNTLTGLNTLVLSNNEIQSVPDSVFRNNQVLTELRLDRQKNTLAINEHSFNGIETSLHRLIINPNTIDKLTFWKLLDKLPNLLELSAGNLNLQTIPDKAFKNNGKIAVLDLESNNIASLQRASFFGLRDSLEVLSLSFNSLTKISECVFSGFTRLHQLHLCGNPLDCDCSLRWLRDWVWAQPDRFLAGSLAGPCTRGIPATVANKLLYEIGSNELTCYSGYVEPTCIDLYSTSTEITTKPTTTTKATTKSQFTISTTAAPRYRVNLKFGQIDQTSVTVMWTINNEQNNINGFLLEACGAKGAGIRLHLHALSVIHVVGNLLPGTRYTFCLKVLVNNIVDHKYTTCETAQTSGGLIIVG